MNILLADSNRDLLQCYQKLLTMDGHAVTTAFDGAQVVSLMGKGIFDIAILEESLPRIELDQLVQALNREKIPVIVLTGGSVTVKRLLNAALPNAYLSLPFLPADLKRLMEEVKEKTQSAETLSCQGVSVDVAGFCFSGTATRLTSGEIDLLRQLEAPLQAAGKRTRVMIQALNEKLKAIGNQARIVYEMEKGYRLVNGYE